MLYEYFQSYISVYDIENFGNKCIYNISCLSNLTIKSSLNLSNRTCFIINSSLYCIGG